MKKLLSIIILICIISFAFIGCKANEKNIDQSKTTVADPKSSISSNSKNSALKLLTNKGEKINDSAIAVILNSPDKSQLDQVSNLDKQVIEESEDKILILPIKNATSIRIEKVKYENSKLITESIVTENKNTPDGYGLYLTATRTEGMPRYQIVISDKDTSTTYILQYNGKDGTPPIEWILPQKSDKTDSSTKVISPQAKNSTQTTINYQLTKNVYKAKNVTVNYPQITNLGDDNKQKLLNEIIKNTALEGFTKGVDDNLTLEINYNIPLAASNFLSIQYYGLSTIRGAAYPTNQFYTTNIDIKNAKKLKLADIIKIDDNFVKSFRNGSYVASEPSNSRMKAAVNQYINNISNEDLIKYFKQADSRNIEENPSTTYSYLTNDSIVISLNVPHAIGDHAEYKIKSTDIQNNIKIAWKDTKK
ncbi:hypothetical protein CLHOM_23950 [Clostridium homopropionicum DSM 5847]|uniref:Lipoprotein n=1 Tax=Clostridium homopropionicum DSM 5847 TaxID=1121318 RepID=A0A0L6Z8K3_9CLOT|nr:hypothetical protein [Clostridium homopropionicum]KOA19289.1 hypothetical protein CLHOM_23950 [Clostridium homopropionicum DSM 5847]SFG19947.1 hypothetical protein SAMN04488501_106154 [Clostridium homopropionicum]